MDDFWRLKLFIEPCPAYHGDLLSELLVVLSYAGLFVYVFLCAVAMYDRSLFHVVAWSGILVTEVAVTLASDATGAPEPHAVCYPHPANTPCRSTALVTFVSMFYLLFEVWFGRRNNTAFGVQCVWYFLLMVATSLAQVRLYLFSVEEVITGMMLGAACALLLWLLAVLVLVPQFQHENMRWVKRMIMVHDKRFM